MKIINENSVLEVLESLDRGQCLKLLNELHAALIACSKEEHALASSQDAKQRIFQPLRTNITTMNGDITLVMPASNTDLTTVKILTAPSTGNLTAMLTLFDPSGTPLGIISATSITPFRTALAVMILFTKYQGPKKNIVIFGAGRQAEWHARLAVILHGPEIHAISIVARDASKAQALAERLQRGYSGTQFNGLAMDSVEKALLTADAVFTCTPSRKPLFAFEALDKNRQYFLSLIGSYIPEMHEIDEPTLLSALASPGAKIFVDSREAALEESGELIDAKIKGDQLVEIGELDPETKIPVPQQGNVLLKAVGMGVMDLAAGKSILDLASSKGVEVDW